jgi:predicted permease
MMLLLILLGAYSRRKGILSEAAAKQVSGFLVAFVMPVLLVHTFQRDQIPALMPGFWATIILSAIVFTVMIVLATFVFRPGVNRKTARLAAVMPNAGFMGIPLVRAATGEDSVLYCVAVVGVFNLAMWCWAVPLLEGKKPNLKKLVINPGVLAFLAGLGMFVAGIRLPGILLSFTAQVTALNTPLSMLMVGVFIAALDARDILKSRLAVSTVLLRNIAFPLLVALLLRVFGLHALFGHTFALDFAILMACPSAIAAMMLPVRAGEDGPFASGLIALSAIVSVITLPLVTFFANWLVG